MSTAVDVNDLGRGPAIVGVLWAFTTIAVLAVALRLYLRSRILHSVGWDDGFMVAAVILQVANQCLVTVCYTYGLGKHQDALTQEELFSILKWTWIASAPGQMVSILARISICILLVRLFSVHKWFKWFIILFTAIQSIFGVIVIILIWTQVSPVNAMWDVTLIDQQRRISQTDLLGVEYFSQSLYTFSDLAYALLPTMIIWNMNMTVRQRLGLALIMAVSIFTAVLSILKTIRFDSVELRNLEKPDAEYTASLTEIFTGLEQTNVIIMGCVPTLRAVTNLDWPIAKSFKSFVSGLLSTLAPSTDKSKTKGDTGNSGAYYDLEENSQTDAYKLGHIR